MIHHHNNTNNDISDKVTVYFEGNAHEVPEGISVAAAVLGHFNTKHTCTNSATGEKRGPHCLMGVCFDCMVEIDGVPNQQGCLITVKEGMHIARQGVLLGGD